MSSRVMAVFVCGPGEVMFSSRPLLGSDRFYSGGSGMMLVASVVQFHIFVLNISVAGLRWRQKMRDWLIV